MPKSQSSSSPGIPAPLGDVSGNKMAMPCSAAGPRKPPFCALVKIAGVRLFYSRASIVAHPVSSVQVSPAR